MEELTVNEMNRLHIEVSQLFRAITVCLPERTGGYFCLGDRTNGFPSALFLVGRISDSERGRRYFTYALEKVDRLRTFPQHASSWQSRDTALGRYGGAIRTPYGIFSFSGLPEEWDQAFMLVLAEVVHGRLPNELLGEIINFNGADEYARLRREVNAA